MTLATEARLGRVRLQVASLARSLAYYREVLGFRILDRADGIVTLGAHGDDTPLIELHELAGARAVPGGGQLGLYHFAILLPDRAALGRFAVHLARLGQRAGAADHLVSEALYLQDPDGLGIEVYVDRARAAWRYVNDEIAMDTTPLDMRDLALAAQGESWTGMPPGTVVGHVHLHVGDIEAAEDFFGTALGLETTVRSYPGALFLSAGGYHHHLGVNTWAGANARRPTHGDARLLEWTIVLPDAEQAEAAAQSLERAGNEVSRAHDGWIVSDPWGTMLRIAAAGESE